MKPVTVHIHEPEHAVFGHPEIRYALKTLLSAAGYAWRFARPGTDEVPDVSYGPGGGNGRLVRIVQDVPTGDPAAWEPYPFESGQEVFLAFGGPHGAGDAVVRAEGAVTFTTDIVAAAYYLLTGMEERGLPRDKYDRYDVGASRLHRAYGLHRAPVEGFSRLLKEALRPHGDPVPAWPGDAPFALALGRDVDYPRMIRPIEAARLIAARRGRVRPADVLRVLAGGETFWRFRDWMRMEREHGFTSAFYFCGFRGSLLRYLFITPDPFYDVREPAFRAVMRELRDEGFETGMHASYTAYASAARFKEEKRRVEEAAGEEIAGNRHHYWHVDPERPYATAALHHEAGLRYDSSIVHQKRAGFRRGTCMPYYQYDPETRRSGACLQLPPALMDDHCYGYREYGRFDTPEGEIGALTGTAARYGGVLVVDFHVRTANDLFFPGWGKLYGRILDTVSGYAGVHCDTPGNLCDHAVRRLRMLTDGSVDEFEKDAPGA